MTDRDAIWSALKLLALRAGITRVTYEQASLLLAVRRYLLMRLQGRMA